MDKETGQLIRRIFLKHLTDWSYLEIEGMFSISYREGRDEIEIWESPNIIENIKKFRAEAENAKY